MCVCVLQKEINLTVRKRTNMNKHKVLTELFYSLFLLFANVVGFSSKHFYLAIWIVKWNEKKSLNTETFNVSNNSNYR